MATPQQAYLRTELERRYDRLESAIQAAAHVKTHATSNGIDVTDLRPEQCSLGKGIGFRD